MGRAVRRAALVVAVALVGVGQAFGQVAVDNTGASAASSGQTALNLTSFAVGSGTNRLLLCGVSQWNNPDLAPSATFNGSSLTVAGAATRAESPGVRRATMLYLIAPANVTATVAVSWGGSAVSEAIVGCTSWTGVDQTTPLGTPVTTTAASTTTITTNVTGASGDVVHDVLSVDDSALTLPTGNQTARWGRANGSNNSDGAGQSAAGTGSATAMTWTTASSRPVWAQIGAAIKQASGGGPTCPKTLGLLGVGC